MMCNDCRVVPENRSLAHKRPDLIKEWDYENNGDLTPWNVYYGSGIIVSWKCPICHKSFLTSLNGMNRVMEGNTGCPYCSGKRVCIENCLATINPKLASEWHPTKNGKLTPYDVTSSSHKDAIWICEYGHEYRATIANRSAGKGCSYCAGKKSCKDNCLATRNPWLSKEWDYEKNGKLTPYDVLPNSSKKASWICKICGQKYDAIIANRNLGTSCPYCAGNKVCIDNCLATLNPELAKQWHPTKNGDLTPYDVTLFSKKEVWLICEKGHASRVRISSRNISKCGYCSGRMACEDNCLATTHPELVREWHPTKNGKLTPRDVTHGMVRKVYWKCSRCGMERIASINDVSSGKSCLCYSHVILNDGEICDSLVEALFYLKYKKDGIKFLHRGLYGDGLGQRRYDFYLIDTSTYVEVTSFYDHDGLSGSYINYKKYFETIQKKREYVENVLMNNFEYIQYKPTNKEYAYVKRNMKPLKLGNTI